VTLIEIMITLAVAGIILSLAIPGFESIIRSNRIVANANNLVSSINLARSEAISRAVQVSIRRKGSSGQQWESGWDVFTDNDADGTLDSDADSTLCETGEDCLLRTFDALPTGYTLRTGATFADWVAYLPSGLSRGSAGVGSDTFRLCDNQASASSAALTSRSRSIEIGVSGRPSTKKGTVSCP
jgi:type IV fimbrial biogenesis protein FimT